MPLPVTLCVSTRNAGAQLIGCIESVRPWVSEIVVVDMESEDATLDIAASYGATIVRVPQAGWAEPGRQAGIEAATQPWLLVLDADERAGPKLEPLVTSYVAQEDVAGVWLPRQNFWFGWWVPHSGLWPDWQLRLFRRERATWPGHRTHVGVHVDGVCERAPARPENAIIHESDNSIFETVAKMNQYTELDAERLIAEGHRATVLHIIGLPTLRFLESYIWRRGYRAGLYGLAVALLAFSYWLVTELKVWQRDLDDRKLPRGSVQLQADRPSPND